VLRVRCGIWPAPAAFTLADALVKDIVPSGRAIMRAGWNHGRRRTSAGPGGTDATPGAPPGTTHGRQEARWSNSSVDSFAPVIVYPLWHVGHQNEAGADGSTVHVDENGVFCDESDGDDVKLLGFYSTLERVEERVRQARLLPGFRDEPECFYFDPYELDEDCWTEGFVRVPPGE
jgi:hypothetical protein